MDVSYTRQKINRRVEFNILKIVQQVFLDVIRDIYITKLFAVE